MSRTKHHRQQRVNKCGVDFGAKYNCNKGYSGGTGAAPKQYANEERRYIDKVSVQQGIQECYEDNNEQQYLIEQHISDVMYFEYMLFDALSNHE